MASKERTASTAGGTKATSPPDARRAMGRFRRCARGSRRFFGLGANQPGLGGVPVLGCSSSQSSSAFKRPHAARSPASSRPLAQAARERKGSGSRKSNAAICALAISRLCSAFATAAKPADLGPDIHRKAVGPRKVATKIPFVARRPNALRVPRQQRDAANPQPVLVTCNSSAREAKEPERRKIVHRANSQPVVQLEHIMNILPSVSPPIFRSPGPVPAPRPHAARRAACVRSQPRHNGASGGAT